MTARSASPRTRPPGTSHAPIWLVSVAAALALRARHRHYVLPEEKTNVG